MKTKSVSIMLVAFLGLSVWAMAQGGNSPMLDQNIAKLNLTALPLGSIDLQYERTVARKMSAALGLRIMPSGSLPFSSMFESGSGQNASGQFDRLEYGNFAITPEFRFYMGKHDGPRGFYIAPFARYSVINLKIPNYAIESSDRTINLDGKINGISAGVMFGSQWKLGNRIYLDWWILGGGFGSSSGNLDGMVTLTPAEQQQLREDFSDLDIGVIRTETHVDANGMRVGFDGPWATLRGGLLLGFKF